MQRLTLLGGVLVVSSLLMFGAHRAEGQTLSVTGTCPGAMTFTVTNAPPLVRVWFIHSANTGSWVIPGGLLCFGTTTGLSSPVTVAGFLPTNNVGTATTTVPIGPAVCGNRYLQAIVDSTCATTNVILII